MNWTRQDLDYEYRVCKQTRLGILCEDRTPTLAQEQIAHVEAIGHVNKLKRTSVGLQQLMDLAETL